MSEEASRTPVSTAADEASVVESLKAKVIAAAKAKTTPAETAPVTPTEEPHSPAPEAETEKPKETPEAETPASEPATADPKAFEVPAKVKKWAKELGYSDEEIAEVKSKADSDAIDRAYRRLSRERSKWGREKQELEAKTKAPTTTSPAKPSTETPQGVPEVFTEDDWGEAAAAMNKRFADAIARMADTSPLKSEIESLKATIAKQAESSEAEKEEATTAALDKCFNDLTKKDWDLFGEGSISDMDDDEPECQARVAVVEELTKLREIHPDWSLQKAFDRALYNLHEETYIKASNRKSQAALEKKIAERSAQRVMPPSSRPATPSNSDARANAMRAISNYKREQGIPTTS